MSNRRYTKEDVQTHSAGYYAPYYPAVNVKAYNYPHCWKVADYLDIPEDKAEELLSMIFEQSQEIFWEDVRPLANEIFSDYRVQIYSHLIGPGVDQSRRFPDWSHGELDHAGVSIHQSATVREWFFLIHLPR